MRARRVPRQSAAEYCMFKIRWLDEQGDSGCQRSVGTSQPFPYFRHQKAQFTIGGHGFTVRPLVYRHNGCRSSKRIQQWVVFACRPSSRRHRENRGRCGHGRPAAGQLAGLSEVVVSTAIKVRSGSSATALANSDGRSRSRHWRRQAEVMGQRSPFTGRGSLRDAPGLRARPGRDASPCLPVTPTHVQI